MKKIALYIFILLLSCAYSMGQGLGDGQEPGIVKKVYPNPVENYVFIEFSLEGYTSAEIALLDILGNKVQIWEPRELYPGSQKIKLTFNNLRPGMYLLKIAVNGKVVVKRIRRL